ncbi:hypothetical protein NG800_012055 [Epilithonimonas ginsengisoli]|uniref:Wadjet protein JetD C-terminal domain-containing protein n=1 Tax=Epilithonimonas ginsengisoli TaxID=1245592 RepID=A0ABU4JJ46_9FLAO|nr:hypothetical protein [Chryseobacterium sp. FP211-J200]MDW8549647.1 hypothetical protein [Epilithonimonas ginsengisoli]OAH76775.1 hypothetical protein AXA65_00385 [Chryseobacterium sp. FP211-J200]
MKSLKKLQSKDFTWPVLKALNDLYEKKKSTAKIQQVDYIRYLMTQTDLIAQKKGNSNVLVAGEGYEEYYEANFQSAYQYYYNFLNKVGIRPDGGKNFTEEDIRTLMVIYESRNELRGNLANIEDFSGKIFDYAGSKYLKFKDSVRNAVLKILEIDAFPQTSKDLQYRLVVDYPTPKAIILCENKSFLKQPWNAKELEVKLWHVGGNNIAILDDNDEMELAYPIYYSCDWDFHGLEIFQRIKSKLKNRDVEIKILTPPFPHQYLPSDSFKHNSRWNYKVPFSGLDKKVFSSKEQEIITKLIKEDLWIEEETNVLKDMYYYNVI